MNAVKTTIPGNQTEEGKNSLQTVSPTRKREEEDQAGISVAGSQPRSPPTKCSTFSAPTHFALIRQITTTTPKTPTILDFPINLFYKEEEINGGCLCSSRGLWGFSTQPPFFLFCLAFLVAL